MSFLSYAIPLAAGLAGASSSSKGTTTTQQNSMDPRMDKYVYGSDGNSGLLGSAFGLMQEQLKTGGLNDMQRQGMEMQRQFLMSPQYQQGYTGMMDVGRSLMGAGIAGNPFMGGGRTQMQMPGASGGAPNNAYFANNPDVAQAYANRFNDPNLASTRNMTPEQFAQTHFQKHGQGEQRQGWMFPQPAFQYSGDMNAQLPDYSRSAPQLSQPASAGGGTGGLLGGQAGAGSSGGNSLDGSVGQTIGTGAMTDAINAQAKAEFQKYLALGMTPAVAAALVQKVLGTTGVLDAVNQAEDPLGALIGVQQMTDIDPTYNAWTGYTLKDRYGGGGRGAGGGAFGGINGMAGDASGMGFGGQGGWGGHGLA